MIYPISRKHFTATARAVHKSMVCDKYLDNFYLLPGHRRKKLEAETRLGDQNVVVAALMGTIDDNSLKQEQLMCKHLLVDSAIENGTHSF